MDNVQECIKYYYKMAYNLSVSLFHVDIVLCLSLGSRGSICDWNSLQSGGGREMKG